jgi:acyl CoA:acetate/3-ketoacid CoA transferase beta subunit
MSTRYTSAERRQRTALLLRGGRRALAGAGTAQVDRQLDRINQAATDRYAREAAAALRLVDQAKTAVAAARATERAADRKGRPAAKQARRQAEQALTRAERAAAKYQ